MRICYIISTCDKYLETRVKYQTKYMLKNVDKNDIYFLSSKPNIDKRQFGWNCMDDTQTITWKYIHFIYNMDIPNYDWYIFIDDDTFVFEGRLKNFLSKYNSNESYYIGKECPQIKEEFCVYMSGGAGYAISNKLYKLLTDYIKKIGVNEAYYPLINLKEQWCDDLCVGIWVNKLKEESVINQIHSNLFHTRLHKNDVSLNESITFHKVVDEEHYIFYSSISDKENNYENNSDSNINTDDTTDNTSNNTTNNTTDNNNNTTDNTTDNTTYNTNHTDTVFALIADQKYFNKAKRTIIDLRSKGNWKGCIVLITLDFDLNENFKTFYNITEAKFPTIDKSELLRKIGTAGFTNNPDKRELNKLNQWEKLHIFDDYFLKWSRVIFLDAGLRVLDDVKYLLELEYKDRILAPKDGKLYEDQEFDCQISYDNLDLIQTFKTEFGEEIVKSNYMLNCIWIYDTNILKLCDKHQLIEAMNKYTFCKNNEMVIMNIMFHFKYHLWERFPIIASNGKILFDWSELNNPNTTWNDYCYIKYPATISFEDC